MFAEHCYGAYCVVWFRADHKTSSSTESQSDEVPAMVDQVALRINQQSKTAEIVPPGYGMYSLSSFGLRTCALLQIKSPPVGEC